jgi:hypothetical protein
MIMDFRAFRSCVRTAIVALAAFVTSPAWASAWSEVRLIDGVMVEARQTESGFNEHRGAVRVCTQLSVLEAFVADADRFSEWLPYTRHAELLEQTDDHLIYFVRTSTPWPLKDREMAYRISRQTDITEGVTLDMVGLPDYQPAGKGAVPIQAAAGRWRLIESEAGLDVSYQLFVHPGSVPPFAANGRMATAVGRTLANLASRFPCAQI